MHLGLILDLRSDPSPEEAAMMVAVVEDFASAHEFGDRFSLVAAGSGGGLLVEPGTFRYGAVRTGTAVAIFVTELNVGGLVSEGCTRTSSLGFAVPRE